MKLRGYQQRCKDAIHQCFAEGHRCAIVVMATSTGKTVVFAEVAKEISGSGRVLILAHRDELLKQASKKVEAATGKRPALEKGEHHIEDDPGEMFSGHQIVVSSIQTQFANGMRRAKKFRPEEFSLVIIDEAHRMAARSYIDVMRHYAQNHDLKFLGVTATADRLDKQKLDGKKCFQYDIEDAVPDGYVMKPTVRSARVLSLDFSHVKKSCGELNGAQVDAIMKQEGPLHALAQAAFEGAFGMSNGAAGEALLAAGNNPVQPPSGVVPRTTLIFCQSVEHAGLVSDILNRWVPDSSRAVSGGTPQDERTQIFADYDAGRFPFLCNCILAAEGVDCPRISVVVMGRPTCSRGLYAQMLGRGNRPSASIAEALTDLQTPAERIAAIAASDKPQLLIIDLVGNSGKHKLIQCADLFCQEGCADLLGELSEDQDIDVLAVSQELADDAKLAAEAAKALEAEGEKWDDDARMARAFEKPEDQDAAALAMLEAKKRRGFVRALATMETHEFDPLANANGEARHNAKMQRAGSVTPEIADKARGMGISEDAIQSWSGDRQAWTVISKVRKKRCSDKQAFRLRRLGYAEHEIHSMNFAAASKAIDLAMSNKGAAV